MMDVATRARKYIEKSLSLKTVCCCIKKCNLKLYYAKRKAFLNSAQKRRQVHLCPKSSEMDRKTEETYSSGQISPHFSLFLGKTDVGFYVPKMKNTIQTLASVKVQKPASVMVWGCISAHSMGDLHICEGTIDVEAYV